MGKHQDGFNQKRSFHKRGERHDQRRGGEMHQAICSQCGKKCEVPFRPNGSKPVYCNDCFSEIRDGFSFDRPQRDNRDKSIRKEHLPQPQGESYKQQFIEINTKLDRLISAITTLTEIKNEPSTTTIPESKPTVVKIKTPAKKKAEPKAPKKKPVTKKK